MTDEQLAELCKEGEESAFELLIERYHKHLHNFIYNYTREEQLTQDIVQETFIKMINNITKYKNKSGAKFSTWLFTIARNTITDEFRKRRIRDTVSIQDNEIEIVQSFESLEEKIIIKDTLNSINSVIDSLPQDLKNIVFLRYYMGFSYKEISEIILSSPDRVKWRLHYAIDKVRKLLRMKGVNADEAG